MLSKNTICLWYQRDALEAAQFYANTFPSSTVTTIHHAPSNFPGGKQGDFLTVEFTVMGIPCIGLNGGSAFKQSETFSFQVATDAVAGPDPVRAKRAFEAMMPMRKIDIAVIEAALKG